MEGGQDVKGRSRASSTSSLGREVRCGCQYFQSDSLLPERRAMAMRSSSRNTNREVTTSGAGEHEYEPVGTLIPRTMAPSTAPVVRIIDTDVVPVADSDDSIDVKGRFTPGPVLDDDNLVLPLDGQIEDCAMEARELGSGDTSDDLELETVQQMQDRIEERFLSAGTPGTESRTDGEVNTSQVDSSVMEELPLRRGARGLPQRLRSQAGKLRSRIKGIQRPNFTFPIERNKSAKPRSSDRSKSSDKTKSSGKSSDKTKSSGKSSDKTKSSGKSKSSDRSHKIESRKDKPSRMDRIRSSLPERPRFSFPDKSKFRLPDRSKFHLPERPKINLPNLPKLPSRSSFHLPHLPGRRRAPSLGEQQRQYSNESTAGSKKNIFDFSTVPRLFDRRSKEHGEYTTSSPKESRAQLSESATLPRPKKPKGSFGSRWTARFTDIKFDDEEMEKPWKHSSSEKPRLSLAPQESIEDSEHIAWIEEHRASIQVETIEKEEPEVIEEATVPKLSKIIHRDSEESYEPEPPQIDPRLYGDQDVERIEDDESEPYRVSFAPVDPRKLEKKRIPSEEEEDYENEPEVEEEEENFTSEPEDESVRSDREQQASSGSSCDRRRRGVIEEIDSDEFFLRAKGISQDDMNVGKYLTSEIRDALRMSGNALAHEITIVNSAPSEPPQRPARKRDFRKHREESLESFEAIPPNRPKRLLRRSEESDYGSNILDNDDSISSSRHRIVYHAESAPLDLNHVEPLDDIIVVKPVRRKSRTSLRSSSLAPSEPIPEVSPETSPPPVPQRRKRRIRELKSRINDAEAYNGLNGSMDSWRIPEIIRRKSEPPVKPARVPSRETVTMMMRKEEDYIEPEQESEIIPVPPKRRSRSRGTSIIQDDDRISRGAESMSDIAYADADVDDVDDEEDEDNDVRFTQDDYSDSRRDFPGYAVIEKRDKPPRPPPPQRKRREKFATTPRRSPGPPRRPQRAYSTLRPKSPTNSEEDHGTPYVEIGDEDGNVEDIDAEHRDLTSGQVLMKMAGRPLPAPPRPPRTKEKDKTEQIEDLPTYASSTQTDPLPDDMVIEEEIMQARVIITPSRSGSQILVSTERIPSPQQFHALAISDDEIAKLKRDIFKGTSTRSEPELATEREEEAHADSEMPEVPPLPASHLTSAPVQQTTPPQRPPRSQSRSQSLSVTGEDVHAARMSVIEELEERLTALLKSETFKIANLEVGDLRVDKLSVSALEAHKIVVSELDAMVVSAAEITSASDNENKINPSLLRELIAIRSELEAVAALHAQSSLESHVVASPALSQQKPSSRDATKLDQLQLDSLSKTTESRALYSTQGSEQKPLREYSQIPSEPSTKEATPVSSKQSSRAHSPVRTTADGTVLSRETASPIKHLPPAISVTPDIVENPMSSDTPGVVHKTFESPDKQPQRATISYSAETSPGSPERPASPVPQQFITFQTSQIPPQFFALSSPTAQTPANSGVDEPGVIDMTQQLLRALRLAGKRAMQHFVGYIVSRVSVEESEAKIREVELTLCALLLIIAGLLIVCFAGPRTITHHHHWDYFNPPRL